MKIAIAMSGGVDSTAAALKLLDEDYYIEGFTMLLFDTEPDLPLENSVEKARQVCNDINIKHNVVDLRIEFRESVIDYFIESYLKGYTPNPCIFCNPTIKFGALYEFIKQRGFDKLASGHYAKIEKNNFGYNIKKGVDTKKDQSYFLSRIPKHILKDLIFPLGDTVKAQTVKYLLKKGIHIQSKESQEVCFIPDGKYVEYIKSKNPDIKKGDFIDQTGNILGKHNGIPFYTIGQRRGLGVSLGKPGYVRRIIPETNQIEVGDPLTSSKFIISDLVLYIPEFIEEKLFCKIRYRHNGLYSHITKISNDEYEVELEHAEKSVTPGQAAVFYKDDVVAASGIINKIIQ